MDGVSAVQSRIAEIQTHLLSLRQATSPRWSNAAAAAGLTGTSSADGASAATAGTASEESVVTEARKYLGVPYLWGGTDPATGLDCSGFTKLVYGKLGVDLPRTSGQQATSGRAVASMTDARPGDLLFFDHSSARGGIDHVGIYIGNGQMIAAPKSGDVVRIQDAGTPAVIRRVLPETGTLAASGGGTALAGVPYADLFTRAANRHGVDASVLAAVASQESGFDSQAVSPAGARGLMQFMPATAAGLGVNPMDPSSAIDGAARYLSDLKKQFGSTELALAAYNSGPGTVRRYGDIPPIAETQNYVRAVMSKARAYS